MTFGSLTIPRPHSITIDRELIGDRARTAGGKDRMDLIAVKRRWRIETQLLTASEAWTITDYLHSADYDVQSFQAAGMTSGVDARVVPDSISETLEPFGVHGGWQQWGRRIRFEVIEA